MEIRYNQAVGMKELIATLVVSGILLIVGIVVFAKVKDSMPSVTGDATLQLKCATTAYDAFELAQLL